MKIISIGVPCIFADEGLHQLRVGLSGGEIKYLESTCRDPDVADSVERLGGYTCHRHIRIVRNFIKTGIGSVFSTVLDNATIASALNSSRNKRINRRWEQMARNRSRMPGFLADYIARRTGTFVSVAVGDYCIDVAQPERTDIARYAFSCGDGKWRWGTSSKGLRDPKLEAVLGSLPADVLMLIMRTHKYDHWPSRSERLRDLWGVTRDGVRPVASSGTAGGLAVATGEASPLAEIGRRRGVRTSGSWTSRIREGFRRLCAPPAR